MNLKIDTVVVARLLKKLSKEHFLWELSEKLGISESQLSALIHKRRPGMRATRLEKLAKMGRVPPATLLEPHLRRVITRFGSPL